MEKLASQAWPDCYETLPHNPVLHSLALLIVGPPNENSFA